MGYVAKIVTTGISVSTFRVRHPDDIIIIHYANGVAPVVAHEFGDHLCKVVKERWGDSAPRILVAPGGYEFKELDDEQLKKFGLQRIGASRKPRRRKITSKLRRLPDKKSGKGFDP